MAHPIGVDETRGEDLVQPRRSSSDTWVEPTNASGSYTSRSAGAMFMSPITTSGAPARPRTRTAMASRKASLDANASVPSSRPLGT